MRRRWWAWLLVALGGLALAAVLGFVIWAETPSGPMPEAVAAMASDDQVTVDRNDLIVFRPTKTTPTTGLVFYPGAHLDPVSYAPAMRALAEQQSQTVAATLRLLRGLVTGRSGHHA